METSKEWAARIRAESDRRAADPILKAEDEAWMDAWMASLPHLPPPPTQPGEVQVTFFRKSPAVSKKEDEC